MNMSHIVTVLSLESRAFGAHHGAMKRIPVAAALLVLPLLAACAPTPVVETTSPVASDTPSADPAPTEVAGPRIDPNDDPFCVLAAGAHETAQEITAQTEGMNGIIGDALTSGDISTVNTWGAELAALDEQMLTFLEEGRPFVETDDIVGAWDTYTTFVQDYSLAVAQEAAVASDTASFTVTLGSIVSDPGLQSAVYFGPAAAGAVGTYITGRCGTA